MKPNTWTFFSNHGHVYFLLALKGTCVMREIAGEVGITERAVQGIIADLEEGGYVRRKKVGRVNHYSLVNGKKLRHSLESEVELDDLIKLIRRAKKRTG